MKYDIPSLLEVKDVEPMTPELGEVYVSVCLGETTGEVKEFDEETSKKLGFGGQILYTRLGYYGGKVSTGVACVIVTIAAGNPGTAVMYAYALAKLYRKNGKIVDTEALALAFPGVFPTKDALHRTWDAQKAHNFGVKGDNMLDRADLFDEPESEKKEE